MERTEGYVALFVMHFHHHTSISNPRYICHPLAAAPSSWPKQCQSSRSCKSTSSMRNYAHNKPPFHLVHKKINPFKQLAEAQSSQARTAAQAPGAMKHSSSAVNLYNSPSMLILFVFVMLMILFCMIET